MTSKNGHRASAGRAGRRRARAGGFSLIELLTVVFIISLLIGILIPSINGARNAAKKATTAKALKSIEVALEMFKQDNGDGFRLTNGYPPSFAHPPIKGYRPFEPHKGQFPFLEEVSDGSPPVVYGAHWLPAMLLGVDVQGYVKRSTVPDKQNLRSEPFRWYTAEPLGSESSPLDRQPLYLDPGALRTKVTKDLPGRPPDSGAHQFPDWDTMKTLPVITDAFDQPVLYYVARAHGRTTNLVEDYRDEDNSYTGGTQAKGTPFYFHEDNEGFTGTEEEKEPGWDFGGRHGRPHGIARSGADLTAEKLIEAENRDTFARYIIDRKVFRSIQQKPVATTPLRPVNSDTFLLISPGPDGLYGTNDDVTNMPAWTE